jgi:hypothetical protein
MNTYRLSWLFACGFFVALGLLGSLTWPTTSVLALVPVFAFLIGVAQIHYNLLKVDVTAPSPLRSVMKDVASHAFIGAVVMVGFAGLSALMGAWVLLVCMLLACSSPGAMRFYRRKVPRAGVDTRCRPRDDGPPPTEHPATEAEREAREMTDEELCQVWQASFHALQAASSPALQAKIVATRHSYLDELARRNAVGLDAWVSSGRAAPQDASPIFSPSTRQSGTPIDWDALMFGQDES